MPRTAARRVVSICATIAAAGSLNLWSAPAFGSSDAWTVADPAGDANTISFFVEPSPDTTPASDDRADLRRVSLETTYDTVTERTAEGKITAIRHIPLALRITVQTKSPARPATGPTLQFRLSTKLGGCYPSFEFKIRGPISTGEEEVAEISEYPPDGVTVGGCYADNVRHARFSLSFQGDTARMEFPFDALAETSMADALAVGVELEPGPHRPSFTRTLDYGSGGALLYGVVDATDAFDGPYVIGSDVPADIDCMKTPTEPACRY